MAVCGRCGARIRWVKTAKRDRWMPLDAVPTDLGTVLLRPEDGRAVVLDLGDRDFAIEGGAEIWRPHFASCGGTETS